MIKKFIKPTKILLEEHKATFDIELNNNVYRDLKYTSLYYPDTGIAFESDKDSVIVKSTDDLMVKTSKKWLERERKRVGAIKQGIRDAASLAMNYDLCNQINKMVHVIKPHDAMTWKGIKELERLQNPIANEGFTADKARAMRNSSCSSESDIKTVESIIAKHAKYCDNCVVKESDVSEGAMDDVIRYFKVKGFSFTNLPVFNESEEGNQYMVKW